MVEGGNRGKEAKPVKTVPSLGWGRCLNQLIAELAKYIYFLFTFPPVHVKIPDMGEDM